MSTKSKRQSKKQNQEPTESIEPTEVILERLDRTALLTLVKQMIQLHPELAQMIDALPPTIPAKPQRVPINRELYRMKVDKIFSDTDRDSWGAERRAAEPLLDIMEIADEAAEQQNYTDAVMLYELIIRGILDNYDTFRWHADEGDLDEVVTDGVEGLDTCLQGEQQDTAARARIIELLYDIYVFDRGLDNDEPVMSREIPSLLVRHTTSAERKSLATKVRKEFEVNIDWKTADIGEEYDSAVRLLLGLDGDTLDDDTFLRLSREIENAAYVIERLLKRGRLKEALVEAQQVDDYDILEIADIFCEQGHEDAAVHLIEVRSAKSNDAKQFAWLQERYQASGNEEGVLDMEFRIFRTSTFASTIERYRTIHELAEQLGRWETVRAELMAYVHQSHNIPIQIQIVLDEGQVKEALELFASLERSENSRYGNIFKVGLEVAQAAEESYPQEAIEIYQKYVETLIKGRGRDNYRVASQHLISIRKIYQKLGKTNEWATYVQALRERNSKLPALRDEMARAHVEL